MHPLQRMQEVLTPTWHAGRHSSHAADQWQDDPFMWGCSQPPGMERIPKAGHGLEGDSQPCPPLQRGASSQVCDKHF